MEMQWKSCMPFPSLLTITMLGNSHLTIRFLFIREGAPHDDVVQTSTVINRLKSVFICTKNIRMFGNSDDDSWGISLLTGKRIF